LLTSVTAIDESQKIFLAARSAHVEGRLKEAESGYRQALEIDQRNADALHLLGVLLAQESHPDEAERLIRNALSIKEVWAFHDNLGKILRSQMRLVEARDAYVRASELKPDHAEALNTAALLSQELGDFETAEKLLKQIIQQWPGQAAIVNNLGNTLQALGRYDEAEHAYRDAIALTPNYAVAHFNLGNLQTQRLQFEPAIQSFRNAIRHKPDYYEAYNNLGNILLDVKQYDAAEQAYRSALALRPHLVEVLSNLGNLYSEQKRYEDARDCFQQALAIDQRSSRIQGLLSYCKRQLCEWDGIDELNRCILTALEENSAEILEPMQLFSEPGVTAEQQLLAGRNKIVKDFANLLGKTVLPARVISPKERLKVGYLSADFHDHATMHLLLGVLENRDTSAFDTFLYSFGPPVEDSFRQRARAACEHFVDIKHLDDQSGADRIAQDGIDILVELKGYTTDARLGIVARRPAPVIISWLGYPGTLGHPHLADYIIGDPIVTPVAHQKYYSERLALMPHCYQPTDCNRQIGAAPLRNEVGLPDDAIVFCSFNGAFKLNKETFDSWCRILSAVPNSVLWLLEYSEAVKNNLRNEAHIRDIHQNRLIFAKWSSQTAHLGRLQLADIALDTYPYGSHTTGSDALWAGVPLISRMGNTFASRVSSSLLHAIDLGDLVTTDWQDYESLAIRLATEPSSLSRLKTRLKNNQLTTPLFSTRQFTRNLERMYQTIWSHARENLNSPLVLQP
jgi:predicted O-linked N-acetylglucosamine transferase (SPINDLY family)